MFDAALPFWSTAGVDHTRGGFYEELDFSGRPTDVAFKRTRVVCRQIYAFSHASLLGWGEGDAHALRGYEYLVRHAWLGPEQGWARRLTSSGSVLDPTPDLYDNAFVLFALAWRFKASGDRDALRRAHETLDFIERHMRPAGGVGFLHERPPRGFRLQNPHMHLLEACLAAFEATDDERFLERARDVVTLFRAHFFNGRTLGENFTDDWRRAPGDPGELVEPGHQFEWAWILGLYGRLSGAPVPEAEALVAFAEQHGVDPATAATFNQIRADGTPLDRSSRTWPNTERIKGHLALFELTSRDPRPAVLGSVRLLLDRYLAVSPRGSWMDVFDADGRPTASAVPTSTLYHVFLAFAELVRLEPRLVQKYAIL
jgi:N-acylglucosamine 2-epimerase/mannose-6-phosphate isomerase